MPPIQFLSPVEVASTLAASREHLDRLTRTLEELRRDIDISRQRLSEVRRVISEPVHRRASGVD